MEATNHANMRSGWPRRVAAALLVVFVLWGIACAGLYRIMHRPPEAFARVMSRLPDAVFLVFPFETMWTRARAGTLRAGDSAPDFTLTTLDHSARLQLSTLTAQRPVVLVFGSYT